ncbi:hypothetical protein ACHAW5_010881 [Stephanodiscus triporus]|uniref:Uncharacterized protein n=1 Tax=Stephanodiscus triporus TaxID=2934178 RepID=A0ABD3MHG9_9STRA
MLGANAPKNDVRNDGCTNLLPIGSVRSIITLNSSPCNLARPSFQPSLPSRGNHGRHRRRGLPIDYMTAYEVPSVAMASFYRGSMNREGLNYCRDDLERITVVATCTPSRDGVNGDDRSRSGRISLAAIVCALEGERQRCRVIGVKYSPAELSFSTVCIVTIHGNAFPQSHSVLVAIDTSGVLQYGESNFDENNHLVDMKECQFETNQPPPVRENIEDSTDVARGKSMGVLDGRDFLSGTPRKSPRKTSASASYTPDNCAGDDKARSISEAMQASINDQKEGGKKRKRLQKKSGTASGHGADGSMMMMSSASSFLEPINGNSTKFPTQHSKHVCSDLPPLCTMNTLSARLELKPSIPINCTSIGPISTCSPDSAWSSLSKKSPTKSPKTNGRKRKHSPASIKAEDATTPERIYLVASSLNDYLLPSESPPIVMLLSSSINESQDVKTSRLKGLAWTAVPGLEHIDVQMTCILFASRSKCGPKIWDGIVSAMRSSTDAEVTAPENLEQKGSEEGVVLMGFQDGTLLASLVATTRASASSNVTLDIGKATTLLQLSSNEPLISLQLLPTSLSFASAASSSQPPLLVCVGALGKIIMLASPPELLDKKSQADTPKFLIDYTIEPYGGRWLSVACVGYRFLDTTGAIGNLSFVGANDTGQIFLHNLFIPGNRYKGGVNDNSGQSIGCEENCFRLPIPATMASSIYAFPDQIFATTNSSCTYVTFTVSSPSGKTTVMRMPITQGISANQPLPSHRRCLHHEAKSSIFSALRGKESSEHKQGYGKKIITPLGNSQHGSSNLLSLLQKLESASANQNKNEARQKVDSISRQLEYATKEIRDVTRIAAYVNHSPSNNSSSPIQFEDVQLKNGVVECEVTCRKLQLTRRSATKWIPSVHILQSCMHGLSPMLRPQSIIGMAPICYRRTLTRDCRSIKVVYGGTAMSYNGCDFDVDFGGTMKIIVPMSDIIPVSIYASVSMVYADHVSASVTNIPNTTWYMSVTIAGDSKDGGWNRKLRTLQPVSHSTGYASARISKGSECDEFLGVSLPFDAVGKRFNTTLDILTYCLASNGDQSALTSDVVSREIAEKHVLRWYQNQSSQANSHYAYVFPRLKEQQLIRRHISGDTECAKVHCCSSSMRCTGIECDPNHQLSGMKTYCVNIGFGPVAMLFRVPNKEAEKDRDVCDVAFAVGSSLITPNESLSILPLIRQAIVRRGLERYYRYRSSRTSKDYLGLLEAYHGLLNGKQTKKITKHIQRTVEELLANIDKTTTNVCPTTILTSSITLYEILRTINISFEFL